MSLRALSICTRPNFGLDRLGQKGERITIKVTLQKDTKLASLYGSYTVGSRHAQLSAELLGDFGPLVNVVSVERFDLNDAVLGINSLGRQTNALGLNLLTFEGELYAEIEQRRLPAPLRRMYSVGGRLYLLIQVLGKRLKIGLSSDEVRLYDSSNRGIVGLAIVGDRLRIKRRFQHPEFADTTE